MLNKIKYLSSLIIVGCASTTSGFPQTDASLDAGDVDSEVPQEDGGMDAGNVEDSGVVSDADVYCGQVTLKTEPVVPRVVLIVDQSFSMTDPFDATQTRWDALKNSLLAPQGLIPAYQNRVQFGLSLFTGTGTQPGETCPYVTQVPAMLSNLEAIRATYDAARPLNNTPTGDSINRILDTLVLTETPTLFVLATDGEPDTCEQPWPQEGQGESVAAVKRAQALGIDTYVLAVAQEAELSQGHISDLANAGLGVASGAKSYRVSDDSGLKSALDEIVSGAISCTVPILGEVTTADYCKGTIKVGDVELPCNHPNGWTLVKNSLVLEGTACAALKAGALLTAVFPCDTVIPQ